MADALPIPFAEWREELGITQKEMAKRYGVTVQTISRWEHPEQPWSRKPSLELLQRLHKDSRGKISFDSFDAAFVKSWRLAAALT